MGKLLVVNLHGLINVPRGTRETLIQLGIGKRFAATVVGDDPVSKGSVHLCKDYVAWAPIEADLLTALLQSRGRVSNSKTLDEEQLKAMGYKTHADLAQAIIKGETTDTLSSVKGAEAVLRAFSAQGRVQALLAEAVQRRGHPGGEPAAPGDSEEDDLSCRPGYARSGSSAARAPTATAR